ncbi:MAG TPA: sulfatase-like hydrolase/transferase [Thermoanaerobaculia bacterium]|nr:sulfatase-like hydrolase/transferase [Thermoanaerobaculia bacterium]
MDDENDSQRGAAHSEQLSLLQRGLHLIALYGLAVAQPIYDITARYPAFLVAHDAGPRELFLLVLAVSFLLPVSLLIVEQLAGLISPAVRDGLHLLFVGLPVGVLVLLALRTVPIPPLVTIIAVCLIAILTLFLFRRSATVRMFISVLAIGGLAFPLLFLVDSEVRRIAFPQKPPRVSESLSGIQPVSDSDAPVVMVVFDELPILSLLDSKGRIDPVRYPNLAGLASTSLWFSNTAAVSDATALAIPALLNGKYPDPEAPLMPIYRDHPVTLFTLMSPSHDLHIFEHFTRMSPPETRTSSATSKGRFQTLFRDLGVIYLHVVTPVSLAYRLPPVTESWKDFGTTAAGTPSVPEGMPPDEPEAEPKWSDFKGDWSQRGRQFTEFLDSIEKGQRPGLFFIHSMLPHAAWEYLPSGKGYSLQAEGAVIGAVGANTKGIHPQQWVDDDWVLTQAYQRHLLQVGFVDNLVGRLIATTKQAGIFDDALIIVTADHGVSFRPGDNRRQATATNAGEILLVPLLIKLPGQTDGMIVSSSATLVDILPTIADALGIPLPHTVDGQSLLSKQIQPLNERRIISDGGRTKVFRHPLPGASSMLRHKLDLFGEGSTERIYEIGPHPEIRGRSLTDLQIGPPMTTRVRIRGRDLYDSVRKTSRFIPTDVRGIVSGRKPLLFPVAVAVNGIVAGLTQTYQAKGGTYEFSALVPEQYLRDGANRIDVFAIETDDGRTTLRPIPTSDPSASTARYDLVENDGRTQILRDGATLSAGSPGWAGWVVSRLIAGGEMIEIAGWAGNVRDGRTGEIVVFSNGEFATSAKTSVARPEVAAQYDKPGLLDSGFAMVRPYSQFPGADKTSVRVFVVSDRGNVTELHYPRDPSRWNFALPQ